MAATLYEKPWQRMKVPLVKKDYRFYSEKADILSQGRRSLNSVFSRQASQNSIKTPKKHFASIEETKDRMFKRKIERKALMSASCQRLQTADQDICSTPQIILDSLFQESPTLPTVHEKYRLRQQRRHNAKAQKMISERIENDQVNENWIKEWFDQHRKEQREKFEKRRQQRIMLEQKLGIQVQVKKRKIKTRHTNLWQPKKLTSPKPEWIPDFRGIVNEPVVDKARYLKTNSIMSSPKKTFATSLPTSPNPEDHLNL